MVTGIHCIVLAISCPQEIIDCVQIEVVAGAVQGRTLLIIEPLTVDVPASLAMAVESESLLLKGVSLILKDPPNSCNIISFASE